jgi:hypothetical protein
MIPSRFSRYEKIIALAVVALAMLLVWGRTRSSSGEGGVDSTSPDTSFSSDGTITHVRKVRIRPLSDQTRPLDQATHTSPLDRSTRLPRISVDSTSNSGSTVQHADPESPQLPPRAAVPFSFAITEGQINVGSPEEEVLYKAQLKFAQDMNSVPNADTGSTEYADQWNRSAVDHDHQIRLFLGGPAYVQLTAKAMQAEYAAKEKSNVDHAASPK